MKPKQAAKLLRNEHERLAKIADHNREFDAAKAHWQVSQQHAIDFSRMDQPIKLSGLTSITMQRIEALKSFRDKIGFNGTQETFCAEVKASNDKSIRKLWTKKEIENDMTILNFIKKYRVLNS